MSVMSVRSESESMSNYFKIAAEWFHNHRWVYDFKATEILYDEVLQSIPAGFQNLFKGLEEDDDQFHALLKLQLNEFWPEEVKKFVITCKELRNLADRIKLHDDTLDKSFASCISSASATFDPKQQPKKWSRKKYSEVIHVGSFVGRLCSQEGCDAVVDIGCGLGYLSSHLAVGFNIPVVGIESEASRVETARHSYESSGCSSTQKFVCLRITEKMSQEVEEYVSDYSQYGVTALHACGSLTPWSLKHFVSNDSCKLVAVVPCCYHKMIMDDSDSFPMSNGLKGALLKYDDTTFLRNQWLWRLASQRCGDNFLVDINKETKVLFYRAVLEKYVARANLSLVRTRRKIHGISYEEFDAYLEKTIGHDGGFDLIRDGKKVCGAELNEAFNQLKQLHDQLGSWSRVITGLLALQGAIQSVAEDVILLDRLGYMKEHECVKLAAVIRVIPESVTPRGMVLCGVKK